MNTTERAPRLLQTREDAGRDPVFEASLKAAVTAYKETNHSGDTAEITKVMENSNSLSMLYKNAVLQNISGSSEALTGSDGQVTTDAVSVLPAETETAASADSAAAESDTTPTASIADVVFSTGDANTELLNKINNANTLDDRLKYVTELRDKIITSLKEAGYSVEHFDKIDKLAINGQEYDVIRSAKGLGRNAAVQVLKIDESTTSSANDDSAVVDAIFKGAESGINILRQLSSSHDVNERRHLAAQIQSMVVEYLNDNGHTASALDSPDKITVDGKTYDFLRSLNAPGQQSQFQALRV
ncbi:MAG: hypothetical protein GY757_37770 [bacterium]|nr:hypothetical protein [bacterium]